MNSAELYDPASGLFTLTASMEDQRYAHSSTLLQNGKVLVTGGFSYDQKACLNLETSPALTSAEVYDPTSGSFTPTGSMQQARGTHTATLLLNGKVLVVGGGSTGGNFPPYAGTGLATAELYDPSTGAFTPTGSMSTPREGPTATLLANGKVLIAGGLTDDTAVPLASAEIYDPATGAFTNAGKMTTGRAGHTATLLPSGKVLITGGLSDVPLVGISAAEIYDPESASFVATQQPMEIARYAHTATLLQNGTVLMVGGGNSVVEVYLPSGDSFSPVGLTNFDRAGHTATLLKDGRVVIIGGYFSPDTAELYQ
jgi:hypothetical protein